MGASRVVALVLASAVLAAVSPARAQAMFVVVQKDGSTFQGELVEYVARDHVILHLATGEVRRFEWGDVASAGPAPGPRSDAGEEHERPADGAGHTPGGLAIVSWPEPDRRPPVYHGQHLTLGGVGGIGAPEGYGGVAVGYEPSGAVSLELGGGSGGSFGPAISETVRVGVPLIGGYRLGLGVGLSQNFLVKSGSGDAALPEVAHFLNLELFHEFRWRSGFAIRLGQGVGLLLNDGDYAGICSVKVITPSAPQSLPPPGCNADTGDVTSSPWTATMTSLTAVLYGRVELLWAFDL